MPRVLSDPAGIRATVDALRADGQRIGFVPTMGALHAGHRSLMRAARAGGSDVVIVSIYVNPLQFGPNEDLAKYPRPREADLAACDAEGVDIVLYLRDDDMVPKGFASFVEVAGLGDHLCGASRPGHFRGVTTIVTKLFHLAKPHAAWFGQKDAQQALILRRMTRELDFGIELHIVPTMREPDGLAMSSRNAYLSPADRATATALSRGLQLATAAHTAGERNAGRLRDVALGPIRDAAAAGMRLDYLELADIDSLTPLAADASVPDRVLVAGADYLGQTRLIDNALLPAGLVL
ncbi:MAG: pantoate--beta-alanine ligase [Planctomycetota bacterium]